MHSWREWADERGYRMVCGDAALVGEACRAVEDLYGDGLLDEGFYTGYLANYLGKNDLSSAKTVIIVAVPRPAHRARFELDDGPFEAVVPPTYMLNSDVHRQVGRELKEGLLDDRHALVPLWAPSKTLATRMGLSVYGRNNVTYLPDLGSYFQLAGYLTDAALEPRKSELQAPQVMPECETCRACRKACPTGAIGEDRFLLRAERCVTLHNEYEYPWPEWLPPSAHNCLVGCSRCQEACPVNEGRLRYEAPNPSFDKEETAAILSVDPDSSPVWRGIKAKLECAGMPGFETLIGRNLKALLAASGRREVG